MKNPAKDNAHTPVSLTRQIARFACQLKVQDIPGAVLFNARTAVADTFGVTMAGANSELAPMMYKLAQSHTGVPKGRTLGQYIETSALMSALVNGTLVHAIDFDDDDPFMMVGHPSGPVLSALIALSESLKPSGSEFLLAYIIGVELEMRLGAAINPQHYDKGWHATSTLGVLGATLACSKLSKLNEQQAAMALGTACSLACGIKANFGTMTKPLHVGQAAQSAVLATILAEDGFTSSNLVMEHPVGFLGIFAGVGMPRIRTEINRLGQEYALEDPGLAIKLYPSCSNTHPAIDLMLDLMKEQNLSIDNVESLTCFVSPGTEKILLYSNPTTGLERKFSMEYCLAVALSEGSVTPDDFTEAAANREAVQQAIKKVAMKIDKAIERGRYGVSTAIRLSIKTTDGREIIQHKNRPKGCIENPLTEKELRNKFHYCCDPILGPKRSDEAFNELCHLEKADSILNILDLLSLKNENIADIQPEVS